MTKHLTPLNAETYRAVLSDIPSEELSEHIPVPDLSTRRQKLTRIFQIGFNKCGTRSLYRFLQRSGIYTAHFNRGRLALRMDHNISHGLKPLHGGPNQFVALTDIQRVSADGVIEGALFYQSLYNYYPNSYFILNTRDKEGWIKSRENHGAGIYKKRYGKGMGLADEEAVIRYWSDMWDKHHENVPQFFEDKPGRLIVYDVKQDDPQRLVDFLAPDFLSKASDFRHEGETSKIDATPYVVNRPLPVNG